MQCHVCIKKLKVESPNSKRRFRKEASILHSVKGHRNISQYLRFCHEPYAIMMEFSYFDFCHFGIEKEVNTLEDFIHFVDADFDFSSFANMFNIGLHNRCCCWARVFAQKGHCPPRPDNSQYCGLQPTP